MRCGRTRQQYASAGNLHSQEMAPLRYAIITRRWQVHHYAIFRRCVSSKWASKTTGLARSIAAARYCVKCFCVIHRPICRRVFVWRDVAGIAQETKRAGRYGIVSVAAALIDVEAAAGDVLRLHFDLGGDAAELFHRRHGAVDVGDDANRDTHQRIDLLLALAVERN